MKIFNKVLFLLVLSGLVVGCTKDFEEINENPNSPQEVPIYNHFAGVIRSTVYQIHGTNLNLTNVGCFAQHYAQLAYMESDKYQPRDADLASIWNAFYRNMRNAKLVIERATSENRPHIAAMSQVMWVYNAHVLTDMWEEVPYSEACRGDEGIFNPKYDTQESIYADMISRLEAAATALGTASEETIEGDLLYSGSAAMWQKFANSLRLRLLMRGSSINGDNNAAISSLIQNDPIFTSNGDNAMFAHANNLTHAFPFFIAEGSRDDYGVSNTMVDFLLTRNDPRIHIYADTTDIDDPGIDYLGNENGVGNNTPGAISDIGAMFRGTQGTMTPMMTFAEVCFLKAEAAERSIAGSDAKSEYEAGVTAAMGMYGIEGLVVTNYLADAAVDYDAAANKEELIQEQKWAALYMNSAEAFAERRRTGYPSFVDQPAGTAFPGQVDFPTRVPYPADEAIYNKDELAKASTEIVDGMWGNKMWWQQ